MKLLKLRKILAIVVCMCLFTEIFEWSSVEVWAAGLSDIAENQEENIEESTIPAENHNADNLAEGTEGNTFTEEGKTDGLENVISSDLSVNEPESMVPDMTTEESENLLPDTSEEEPEEEISDSLAEEAEIIDSDTSEEEGEQADIDTSLDGSSESAAETDSSLDLENEEILGEPKEVLEAETFGFARTLQETYATDGNFANIILFVDFQDTDHSGHSSFLGGQCFMEDAEYTFDLFNGDDQSPRGMRQFISNISYGQLELANIFPQYDAEAEKIIPYQLSNNEDYYYDNDSAVIQEVVQQMRESGQISEDLSVDRNGDGMVDNLTIVVPCQKDGGSDKFYGHKAHFAGDERINGKRVGAYNVLPESKAYLGGGSYGVVIHEFLHTVGYPDLYRRNVTMDTGYPVERWDIMASTSWFVQYPLAYLRGAVTGWFDIPEIEESVQGMSLYAASAASYENRNRQAVILRTEYSDTEFFVLEYRKQGEPYSSVDYDCKIPGSGLIIYRVNLASETNITGDGDMIYVFRPGDSYDDNHLELGGGDMGASFLSAESGRTSYGTHDLGKSLSDGAITFSDGTNSGIVISNVGSAKGDQITFDITYAEEEAGDYWQSVSAQEKEDPSLFITSYMDIDGTLYYLQQKNNVVSGPVYLYTYTSGVWNRCSNELPGSGSWYHLEKYNGSIYSGYVADEKVKLARWSGSKWETVYTSSENAGELDMAADEDGICLAYTSSDGKKLYACRYSGTKVQALGNQAAAASDLPGSRWPNTISNPSVATGNGKIAVMYREMLNSNQIYVKLYEAIGDTWKSVGDPSFSANSGMLRIHRNRLYMLKNGGKTYEENESNLYAYDLSDQNGDWRRVGDTFYANESIADMSLAFQGDTPYIAYFGGASQNTYVMTLEKGQWVSLGSRVVGEIISGLASYLQDGKVYVTYLSTVSNRVYIKSHSASHRYEAVVTEKTSCNSEGIVTYTCVDCGDTYTETTAKLPHQYGQWVTTTASTCKQEGKKTRTCSLCGTTESKSIAKLTTHKYGQWSTTIASTCQKEGKKTRKCTVCGKTETAVIAKKAHTPGAAATCTKAQTCKVCRMVLKKATGHRHTRTETTAATFLKTGLRKTICKDCGAVTAKKTLAKISCKKGQVYTVGSYNYRIISPKTNGTGTVSFEGLAKSVSNVKIGDTVTILGARFKIIQISDKALKNKTGVTSVTIGSNVQTIGKEAFFGMKKLKTLTIKSTKITKVGSNALKNIYASARIKVPKSKIDTYKNLFKNKGQKSSVKIIY